MRRKYYPGEVVAEGIYWKNKTWEFVAVPDGETLPPGEGEAYHRVSRVLVLLIGPLLGLLYVLVVPFVGLLFAAYLGLRNAVRAVAPIGSRGVEEEARKRR